MDIGKEKHMERMKKAKSKWIGDRKFYRIVLALAIPLVIQQGITSMVSLLDNIMVGGLGTESISAVAIVNQILMIYNLTLFGGTAGASIFGAQFFGKGDMDGMRYTFRFKMYFALAATVISIAIFMLYGDSFIALFLQGEGESEAAAKTLELGKQYLQIMMLGLIPFAISQAYTGTVRETGESVAPMIASVIAIFVNLILNYLLIFGKFGFPRLGVIGAAIGTIVSRYVEMLYITVHAHRHQEKYHFLRGAYASLRVPGNLAKKIIITGTPLMLNETLWSLGMTIINQSYSTRGLAAVAAVNITGTAWNLFTVIMMAMGSSIAILVGQQLGAGDKKNARDMDTKLVFLSVAIHTVMGLLMALCSGVIPLLYNIEPAVRETTQQLLIIAGLSLPIHAYVHAVYFTIRSGGKTGITFLFDCLYTWVVPVPLAYCMAAFTSWPIVSMYFCIQFIDIIKVVIGALMLRSDFWANNVVADVGK